MESIRYCVQICKFMFSKDNPKSIQNTCCGVFLAIGFGSIALTFGLFAIMGIIGYSYAWYMYSNIYNMYTGCLLDTLSTCKMVSSNMNDKCSCHLGTYENIFCCSVSGFLITFIILLCVIVCFILFKLISCWKSEVMESYDAALEMTDILVDEIITQKIK